MLANTTLAVGSSCARDQVLRVYPSEQQIRCISREAAKLTSPLKLHTAHRLQQDEHRWLHAAQPLTCEVAGSAFVALMAAVQGGC